jgi:hypothetical protein
MGQATNDDDFSEEIQDIGTMQDDSMDTTGRILSVQYGKESDWFWFQEAFKGTDGTPQMLLWHQPLALVRGSPIVYAGCSD